MPKVTDTQLVILNAAAGRETRAVLPLPRSLKANKGAATSVLKLMVKKGLIGEQPARPGDEPWRKDNSGRGLILILTDTGAAALEGGPARKAPVCRTAKPGKAPAAKSSKAPTRGGKTEAVLALLRRPAGARIADIRKVTGWQPHSIRAALTGLRKRGIPVSREQNAAGESLYRTKGA